MSINIEEKSMKILELDEVLKMLSDECVIETSKEEVLNLQPANSKNEVEKFLDETSAAKTMMVVKSGPAFSVVKDVRPALYRADLGGALNTRELLNIAAVLKSARLVKNYIADDTIGGTSIDYMFSTLKANKYLEEKINDAILGENEISDNASSELSDIRRKIRAAAVRAREALNKIISSPGYSKYLQEPIITMRSDRYVVPVKAEHKNSIPGLVHDISSTGATLFVEPMGAVKANNELRELDAKEKTEIERILAELSAECAEFKDDIETDFNMLIKLDIIFAKAKLSYKLNCSRPVISDKKIVLRHARHPLISKDNVVPINVELGENFDTLVITGPNTGGKTVTLKTLGLLCLMTRCGLHIPVDDGSVITVFDKIFADIGDEQSIEQSLSTFSAHMRNIVDIIETCTDRSLVLFDELGAGTDPTEGAALAIAIIENCRKKGAIIAATTHYSELKVYATEEKNVQNASCEFDIETLKPTYKLLVGIPGKSNAFAISKRLGLREDVIEEARNRIGVENASFESTIEKLEQTRLLLEREREDLAKRIANVAEEEQKIKSQKAELRVRLEKADEKTQREAARIIADARQTAEDTFRELDLMKKELNDTFDAKRINEARTALRTKLNKKENKFNESKKYIEEAKSKRPLKPGDIVQIKAMGVKGTVISIADDKTVQLRAGIINVQAKEDELLLLEGEKETKIISKNNKNVREIRMKAVSSEIDVRGMDSLEAVMVVERYIDDAVMGKMETVTVIHGKGTGVLRKSIQDMLKKNKFVKSFRIGTFGEGESGVTVVNLK